MLDKMKEQRWESYKRCFALPVLPASSWELDWSSGRTIDGVQYYSYVSINGQLFRGAKLLNGVWHFWTKNRSQTLIFTNESAPCL